MKYLCLVLTLFSLAVVHVSAKHYAVLVAGSKGYVNYRHQADIFHAYQILINYGFQPENIITFAYDDVAHSFWNPFPGKIFNKPSSGPGKDVYAGTVIDYKKKDVTPKNFLSVLKGDSAAVNGNKVLNSTSEDNVFIYFADHGAPGLIAFPKEYLYADDFMGALQYMNQNKMYNKMVIYIEACESGSMFNNILPDNISIYATTAANPSESSVGTYCHPNNKVDGKNIRSCLGDLYSVNFLENLESTNTSVETLLGQYQIVKNETTASHVMQYGNLDISNDLIGYYEADDLNNTSLITDIESEKISKEPVIDSRLIRIAFLENLHEEFQTEETRQMLQEEIESIQRFDTLFSRLTEMFGLNVDGSVDMIDFSCLKTRIAMFEEVCGKFSDYGLKYVKYLHFTCNQGADIYDFEAALVNLCL